MRRSLARVAISALVVAGPALAQKGTYREEPLYCAGFARQPIYPSCTVSSEIPNGPATSISVTLPPRANVAINSRTNGPYWWTFAEPLPIAASASVTWKAPFDPDPNRSFTATLTLNAIDEGPVPDILLCSAPPQTKSVKANTSATFTVSLGECKATLLHWFNPSVVTTEAEIQFRAELSANGTIAAGKDLYAWLRSYPNWNEVSFTVFSPQAPGNLRAGSSQPITGNVYATLGTKTEGDVRVKLLAPDGSVLATAGPIHITRFDISKPFTVPAVTLPATSGTLSLVFELTASDTNEGLATARTTYRIEECVLTGLVRRSSGGKDFWLPDVPVELREGETVLATAQARRAGSGDRASYEYCVKGSDLPAGFNPVGKQFHLVVKLQDALPPASPTFLVTDSFRERTSTPLAIRFAPFGMNPFFNRRDLNVDRSSGLSGGEVSDLEAAAEVYWHVWRQVHEMLPRMSRAPLQRSLPLEIGLNAKESHFCPIETAPGCYAATSIGLGRPDSLPGAPPDTIWHEFGHYLLSEIYGADVIARPGNPDVDENHNGYANDYTTDSMDEGFATFWAALTQRTLGTDPKRELGVYQQPGENGSTQITLETNYQAADPQKPKFAYGVPPHEELAFAGTLWDLLDTSADSEERYGTRFTDGAALGATNVVSLFDGKPSSVLKVYTAAQTKFGAQRVDPVFLLHGFFHDKQGDGLFHEGDEVGRAANGGEWKGYALDETEYRSKTLAPRPSREAPKPVPGSYLEVKLVGPDGTTVPLSQVIASIEYPAGFEALNTRQTLLVKDGKVYFQLPPPDYDARAVFSVPGSGAPPFVIDSQTYWSRVPAVDHIAEATFVVPPDVPQLDAVSPAASAGGTRVTLLGRNFAADVAGNVVTFGSERAAVVSASPTQLSVTVPATLPGGTYDVTVSRADVGSGVAPFDLLAPALEISPASLDFGTVAIGQAVEKTFTVRNGGSAALTISALAVPSPFTAVPPVTLFAPVTVEAGTQQVFTVRFAPSGAAPASSALVLSTNDVSRRTASVALRAGGSAGGPDIAVAPDALGFGSVASGASRNAILTVRNAGTATLNVTAVTSSLTPVTLVSPAVPFSVAPGAEQALTLRYAPTAAGAALGSITLSSNDLDEASVAVPISGTGTAAGTTPASCTYALTPGTAELGPGGGSGSVTVTTAAGCVWTAASAAPFVTLSGAGGSGTGSLTFTVLANGSGVPRSGRLTVADLPFNVAQRAEDGATTTVPIVLTSAGVNGSFFTSELTLTNRGQASAVAEFTYNAAFGGGSGTGTDVVPAGAQLVFPDAITYLRSLGVPIPAEGNRGGTLRVRFLGLTTPSSAAATVRTASVVPEGRAGLAYGSVPRGAALTSTAYLCGLRQNETDRSNVAVLHAGTAEDGEVVLRLTVVSGDAAHPATVVLPDVGLGPGSFAQFSGLLGQSGLSNGWVKVERVSGSAPYFAYAVINDQANSDGSFVPPVTADALAGKKGISLPVAVEVSTFDTELVVTNFGAAAKSFRVTFVADTIQAPDNAASLVFDLAPGEQRILPDFVQVLRARGIAGIGPRGTTYAGAVFLDVASGDVSGLFLGARTSSPGGGGRYGLFYTGVPHGAAASDEAWLYGLQQNADNRSNVAIVNTGEKDGSTDTFTLVIYDGATGSQVAQVPDISVGPRRWTQLSSIVAQQAPDTRNAYVKVTRTAGTNPFLAYAVVNDGGGPGQRSGDGAFVSMQAP